MADYGPLTPADKILNQSVPSALTANGTRDLVTEMRIAGIFGEMQHRHHELKGTEETISGDSTLKARAQDRAHVGGVVFNESSHV